MTTRSLTRRAAVRPARLPLRAGLALAVASSAAAATAGAQDRLLDVRTASVGLFFESYRFGGGGLAQAGGVSAPPVVESASQLVVPLSIDVPLGARWNVDVAGLFTSGQVRHTAASGEKGTASLSGVGDVRVRATGRLVGDNLLLTLGANLASGLRELSTEQVTALGVLAAPALGSALPAVSGGPSVTSGLVLATQRGGWAWTAGAGVEVRGEFAPVAALQAGVPALNFDPGPAVHLSLGTDGFLADGALSLAITADVYTQDRIASGGGAGMNPTTVQLGPTLGAELRWRAPTTRFRDVTLYVADHYRAPFTRDDERVDGTSANYLTAGMRASYPLGRLTELTTSVELWNHTGLSVDRTLITAATTSGALGLGIARRVGAYTVQPYVRLRAGTIDTGAGTSSVTGGGAGVNLVARF